MAIWFLLAFQAGSLNAGGYLACHRFVTHTTGFATLFGIDMARGDANVALGMITAPLFFLTGSFISAYFVDRKITLGLTPRYTQTFFLMSFLTFLIYILGKNNTFGEFGNSLDLSADYSLLALLCLTSGIQNATITSVSGSVVRTTHLTGLTTDLGIGLMRLISGTPKGSRSTEIKANWMRIGIISSFILGSWLSAFYFINKQYGGFLIPLTISLGLWGLSLYFSKVQSAQHGKIR